MNKKAIIIGAGPAGLTAGYELLKRTDIQPAIFEESDDCGGISKTIEYHGNRMDLGGHRFFSKNDRVTKWWNEIMPLQNPYDIKDENVMLVRKRVSRIYYLQKFFDYPISLKTSTFTNLGLLRTLNAGFGYLFACVFKRKEKSLEDFYINRFGKPLYRMFFEDYTEKVWGIHPSKLDADWGAQRVKGLSVKAVLKDMMKKKESWDGSGISESGDAFNSLREDAFYSLRDVETSLIEHFIYPKFGPGQFWNLVGTKIKEKGGEIDLNSKITEIHVENNNVTSVYVVSNGLKTIYSCDYLFSSMPIKDLISALIGIEIPDEVRKIASELPYRDFITVGLLVKDLNIKNKTKIKTYRERVPDTWIYIQERGVKLGRLQIFNNWSPYMVKDYENTMFIGLEYFCNEGDEMWNMPKDDFIEMATKELIKINILKSKDDVADATQVKVKKAYPAYYGSYNQLNKVVSFLDGIENLYCIGRNGQHHYNNMDHSMLTAMESVDNIVFNRKSKENLWNVNTEKSYHEEKN